MKKKDNKSQQQTSSTASTNKNQKIPHLPINNIFKKKQVQQSNNKQRNEVSKNELMQVKDHSFELQSPLSSNPNRFEAIVHNNNPMKMSELQHVEKDDLLAAESLPISIQDITE